MTIECSNRQPGVQPMLRKGAGREGGQESRTSARPGEPATPMSSAWRDNSAVSHDVLAAARRRHVICHHATIAATANSSRFSSVSDRVEKAKGMTVLQAMHMHIHTLRTLRSDETVGRSDADDLRSAGIPMGSDNNWFIPNPVDDFSD